MTKFETSNMPIMTETLIELVKELKSCKLEGTELEEKEFLLLQELCGSDDNSDILMIADALAASGTILAVPVLCGLLKDTVPSVKVPLTDAITLIKKRAKKRGSFLPDEFFTEDHWQPEWMGTQNGFLTYVQFIADSYIKCGFGESEMNRIGQILAEEMDIDIAPFNTFADYRICQTGWDHDKEYQVVLDKIAEEKLLGELEEEGIYESDVSTLMGNLRDLQYDYMVARLKLKGDLRYYRYMLEIAECLNQS